jgi:hypothetical protein
MPGQKDAARAALEVIAKIEREILGVESGYFSRNMRI